MQSNINQDQINKGYAITSINNYIKSGAPNSQLLKKILEKLQ